MAYAVTESRTYSQNETAVLQAALGAVKGLEGSVEKQADGQLVAKFDKKILGKVLGDRTRLEAEIGAVDGGTAVSLKIYPIDPVGRELMFGARKGVSQTVLTWFWAHLEHRLN